MALRMAVNGRGIVGGEGRCQREPEARRMAISGLVFALAALRRLEASAPAVAATAYMSISPTLYDPTIVSGNLTFRTFHAGESEYLDDVDSYENEGVAKVSTAVGRRDGVTA